MPFSSRDTALWDVPAALATSTCSGLGKHPALAKRTLHNRAAYYRAPTRYVLRNHNHVDRRPQVVKLVAQARRLSRTVCDRRLDHQHVVVRAAASGSAGTRSEQHHLRARRRGHRQASANLRDDLPLGHSQDGRPSTRPLARGDLARACRENALRTSKPPTGDPWWDAATISTCRSLHRGGVVMVRMARAVLGNMSQTSISASPGPTPYLLF